MLGSGVGKGGGKWDMFAMMGYYGGWMGKGRGKGKGNGQEKVYGDPGTKVYVGNLPSQARWQELKDHMKQAGDVEFVSRKGKSAQVRYSSVAEAQQAIATLNGSELMGNKLEVDVWTAGWKKN